MPFTMPVGGDRFREESYIPKKPLASYTAVVGDLLVIDTTEHNAVAGVVANSIPYGMVTNTNNGNGTLSVVEFTSGTYIELPYTGAAPTLGFSVQANGTARDSVLGRTIVKSVAADGKSLIVAIDANTRNGTGFVQVRY